MYKARQRTLVIMGEVPRIFISCGGKRVDFIIGIMYND